MTSSWQRLSEREAGIPPEEVLHEGVPPHLEHPLRNWILNSLEGGGATGVALRLQIIIDPYRDSSGGASTLAFDTDGIEILDVIDTILNMSGPWPAGRDYDYTGDKQQRDKRGLVNALTRMLDEGASAYTVDIPAKRIVHRTDPASAAAYSQAQAAAHAKPDAGSAAAQIQTAWSKLHALHPDPPAAYRQAVTAVESAAHAIIEPNNATAHMGTMLGHLRSNPARYALAIPGPSGTGDITPLINMMGLLWSGQTSRHGSQTPSHPETLDEATMAVHLAVTLVHWFTTGAVRRVP
jgi:hypothetical protein